MEIKSIINSKNNELTDKKNIAQEFNNFFSTIGKKLADKIGNLKNSWSAGGERRMTDSFLLTPVTEKELNKHIMSLKNGVKGGEDEICSNIIKQYKDKLIQPIMHIVNIVFCTGVYPEVLKTAVIIPLYKQGDKKITNNYGPIALTSTVSKIMEKCLRSKL